MISTKLKKLVDHKNECCCEYHLAHKCKEWAKKKEYWAISGYDEGYFCMLHDMPDNRFFDASTEEIEAIFKACEYIMEQTKCGS